ncbi:hypothetical protein [Meiothermus sp. Pnk-1]|uniref:hypothetical protein n=2 Tax=unclassified Meiothermus TaxID=370471 RepID=UPI00101FD81C|nr:hypothetical protein [Meiothermus sp. Pnk-1]RYM36813.1 hypothetical protein EWH23_08505 [Meiothermus sp. PNK-Is4]
MKKLAFLGLAGLLVGLISACSGIVEVIVRLPIDFGQGNKLVITNARLSTNYYDGNSSNPTYYICDNKTTIITYSFTYNDPFYFGGWSSQLRGYASGEVKGQVNFSANDPRNNVATRTVTVDYQVYPGAVPLNNGTGASVQSSGVSAQSIIVVPNPSIVGRTYVDILVKGANGAADLTGTVGPLKVIDNCP